jgi:hypothetical protein
MEVSFMAKLTGPLHSLSASGSIGGSLTMLQQHGRAIGKKKSKPGGQASAAQLARRALYQACVSGWNAYDAAQKAAWKPAADAAQITPFNAYMRASLRNGGPLNLTIWDSGATTWDNGATTWI